MVEVGESVYYGNRLYRDDLELVLSHDSLFERLSGCRVLVTGATGLIGSFFVDVLMLYNEISGFNVQVFAVSRNKESLIKRFKTHIGNECFHIIEYDVTSPLNSRVSFDYIIHAAGNSSPRMFAVDPVGTIMTNILGTYNLLEYGCKMGIKRFLFVSSGEVYGQGAEGITGFDETYSGHVDNTNKRACYPNSKRAAESLCVSYTAQYNIDTVIARPCHIYGPTMTENDDRASAQFIRSVLFGNDIVMKSDGSQLRSYCYVADCVSALFTVLMKGETGHAYNIANPNSSITIRTLAETIAAISGRNVRFDTPSEIEKSSYNPVTRSVLSVDKLERLGWKANYDITTGLQRTIEIMAATNPN